MNDRDLMQQALDALKQSSTNAPFDAHGVVYVEGVKIHKAAIAALRERLAQPEQEPVAYAVYHRMGGGKSLHWPEQHSLDGDANAYQLAPLYTSPPQRKPLTDEEVDLHCPNWLSREQCRAWVRQIEAAHGIKENT
jgi:hypothetical protein